MQIFTPSQSHLAQLLLLLKASGTDTYISHRALAHHFRSDSLNEPQVLAKVMMLVVVVGSNHRRRWSSLEDLSLVIECRRSSSSNSLTSANELSSASKQAREMEKSWQVDKEPVPKRGREVDDGMCHQRTLEIPLVLTSTTVVTGVSARKRKGKVQTAWSKQHTESTLLLGQLSNPLTVDRTASWKGGVRK